MVLCHGSRRVTNTIAKMGFTLLLKIIFFLGHVFFSKYILSYFLNLIVLQVESHVPESMLPPVIQKALFQLCSLKV